MNHETQVGKLKSLRSYWKYCVVYKHLAEFVEKRYKASDIALKKLTPAFITDFELFLKVERTTAITRSGRIQRNKNLSKKQPYKTAVLICILNKYLVV